MINITLTGCPCLMTQDRKITTVLGDVRSAMSQPLSSTRSSFLPPRIPPAHPTAHPSPLTPHQAPLAAHHSPCTTPQLMVQLQRNSRRPRSLASTAVAKELGRRKQSLLPGERPHANSKKWDAKTIETIGVTLRSAVANGAQVGWLYAPAHRGCSRCVACSPAVPHTALLRTPSKPTLCAFIMNTVRSAAFFTPYSS